MEHALNVNVAKQFDIDTALFLQNLKHWTLKNLANKKHIHDGLCWSYDTLEALGDIFPYWSKKQLERVINNCVKFGLITKGNYNTTSYDRTCWYALTPKSYYLFPELCAEKYLKLLYSSISPNGEMEYSKWRNQFPQTETTIPDTNPYTDPDINKPPISPTGGLERFDEFWDLYPIKTAKKACAKQWKFRKLDLLADEIIGKLNQQVNFDDSWIRGFVPNPSTYLTQDRWNDEIKKRRSSNNSQPLKAKYDDNDTSWRHGEVL